MYKNYASSVIQKALASGKFESQYELYLQRAIRGGSSSDLASGVKLIAKAMAVLASHRPELTTGTIINSRVPDNYGFPLVNDMIGYSDLAVLFLPVPTLTAGADHMGQLRAVTVHLGVNKMGDMAQISLVFQPIDLVQAFDTVSFDLYGQTTCERRRAFGNEREFVSDVKSCVVSALGIGNKPGSFSCWGGSLIDFGWTVDKLADSLIMIAEYLCVLAIRE